MESCYLPPWSTSNDDESTTSEDTSPRGTKRRSTSIHSLYEPHAKAMTDSQGPKACHTRCHIYQRAVHRIFAFSQPKKQTCQQSSQAGVEVQINQAKLL